jgi:hypothetical protein
VSTVAPAAGQQQQPPHEQPPLLAEPHQQQQAAPPSHARCTTTTRADDSHGPQWLKRGWAASRQGDARCRSREPIFRLQQQILTWYGCSYNSSCAAAERGIWGTHKEESKDKGLEAPVPPPPRSPLALAVPRAAFRRTNRAGSNGSDPLQQAPRATGPNIGMVVSLLLGSSSLLTCLPNIVSPSLGAVA